jgi:hypothetical protein
MITNKLPINIASYEYIDSLEFVALILFFGEEGKVEKK